MIRSARLARLEQARGEGRGGFSFDPGFPSLMERLNVLAARLAASGHAPPADEAYNRRMRDELAGTLSRLRGGCYT
jgi:hypothetical protein